MAEQYPTTQENNVKADDQVKKSGDTMEEGHHSLGEILHISPNSCGPNESIEQNNQATREKIKEAVTGGRTEDKEVVETEEKKNFMEAMKDKLPGAHKNNNTVEETTPVMEHPATETNHENGETEKKGFMEKIKEKLPGHHKEAESKAE